MSYESLDVIHRPLFKRRRSQRMIGLVGTRGHVVETLLDYAQALAHLLNADQRAGIAVATGRGRNIEFKMVITGVRPLFAKVPLKPASPQIRSGHTPLDCLIQGVTTNTNCACFEDSVLH